MQMDPIFSVGWMPYITRLPGKNKQRSICILNRGYIDLNNGILPDTAISPYIRRGPFFRGRPPRFKMQMDPIFSVGWMPYITGSQEKNKQRSICILNRGYIDLNNGILPDTAISPYIRRGPFLGVDLPDLNADGPDLFRGMDALYNQAPRKKNKQRSICILNRGYIDLNNGILPDTAISPYIRRGSFF